MVDYPNIFALGQDAFNNAYGTQRKIGQDMASRQAGEAIAGGDYTGGANVFNRAGMIDQAHNVVADQQVIQDRQTAATNLAQDRATKLAAQKADAFGKLADAAATIPQGQRLPWLQQHVQDLSTLGIPADQLSRLTENDLSDQSLSAFKAALGKVKEDYTVGGVRYAGNSNKPVAGFAEFDPHKTIYAVGDGPPAGAPDAAAPAATPAAAPAAPTPVDPNAPRSVRNNNPLNLTNLPQGQWSGQSGTDGRFATFSSPEAGIAAADQNLQAYATHHGINTLSGIINRWAPSGDGANNPKAYIQTVSQDIGVDPNQPLNLADPKVRAVVLHAMAKVEGGASGASNTPQATQVAAAPAQPPPPASIPGFHVVSQAKPEWQDMPDGRQRNMITGKVEGQPTATDDVPLTPEAVKLLAGKYLNNGTLPSMGMGKTGTRNRDLILNEATAQAKALDLDANDLVAGTVTGKAAAQALNKLTSMRSQVEASEQTVLANAQNALTLAPQATGGTVPVLNRWIQAGRKQVAGDPQVAKFDLAIGTVADEYAKVMTTSTGTGSTTSDSARQEAYRRINSALTPQQLQAVVSQMKIEMDNRLSSLRDMEAGLRNTVRSGGQPGGLGSAPLTAAPAASATPPAAAGWGPAKIVRR